MHSDSTLDAPQQFILAAASYFGIPPEQVARGSFGDIGETFNITVSIALTVQDVVQIARRMEQSQEPEQAQGGPEPARQGDNAGQLAPTYTDIAREPTAWRDVPEVSAMYETVMALGKGFDSASREEKAVHLSRWHYVVAKARELDEGKLTIEPGGRQVVHVDAPEGEDDALPETVWVDRDDCTGAQFAMASDATAQSLLVQVSMLTEEQKAKYGVATKPTYVTAAVLRPAQGGAL